MKALYTMLILLCAYTSASAYAYLQVRDPRAWQSGQGQIDSAVLTIKPHGAYFEYGLYLTISGGYMASYHDTTEITLDFTLPEGAMIEDSWLWVGNDIVQADLIERNTANNIYEGIVQRRQDPSILFKNSNTDYQIRIFPLPPGQSRKVKISYLVPVTWTTTQISAALPIDILRSSTATPKLTILAYTDSVYRVPVVSGISGLTFTGGTAYTPATATTSASQIVNSYEAYYSLQSPLRNGTFLSVYPTSANSGYYQLVATPNVLLDTSAPVSTAKKTVFILDYESIANDITSAQAIAEIKNILHTHYTTGDSFNLMFARFDIRQLSNTWIPCDYTSIENASVVDFNNPHLSYSNLQITLTDAIGFIKNNGGAGDIFLMANSNDLLNTTVANQLIDTLYSNMQPYSIPINILNYTMHKTGNHYGNSYFYTKLAQRTGGNYQAIRTSNSNIQPLSQAVNYLFNPLNAPTPVSAFGVHADLANGFTYATYSTDLPMATSNLPVIQIGKYYGTLPMQVQLTGVINNQPLSRDIIISSAVHADSFTRKLWVGKWLNEVENSWPDAVLSQQAIDSSIQNRVLSRYTAFLALEPSDTVSICSVCLDPTTPGGPAVGISQTNDEVSALTAQPNPFSSQLTISITLAAATTAPVLKIYNLMGQVVKQFDINNGDTAFTLTWNGEDNTGRQLSAGIYILTLETEKGKQTIKLLKQ